MSYIDVGILIFIVFLAALGIYLILGLGGNDNG